MRTNKIIVSIGLLLLGLIVVNFISSKVYQRFDLTKDKRYTLSNNTKTLLETINSPLIIDVFLEGDFPSEFRLLQTETKQFIEELQLYNSNIFVNYINPVADEDKKEQIIKELTRTGLTPYINTDNSSGKITKDIIFPWAFASYGKDNTVKVPLLKSSITQPLQAQINNSVAQLEYHFADAITKLTRPKTKAIAILKGNGQLNDIYIADFLKTIKPYYNIAPFTLDSVANNIEKTLNDLKKYDLLIVAKPTEPFSEQEKLVLDQFTMNGGKSLWLTEAVIMDKDSLNATGSSVSVIKDLKLNDFFFKYGVRINPSLVKDLYSAPIMLAIGNNSNAQLQPIQWQYSPLAAANPKHPISKKLNLVKFDFASPIDTLKTKGLEKTILLQSSPQSKLEGVPTQIALSNVTKAPDASTYNLGSQNMAVLLEGTFTSVYDKRVLPFKLSHYKSQSKLTKMVVVSDGDVIKNEVLRNQPQELGFDRFTGKTFGNKTFLLNCVNYLLEDTALVNTRAKELKIAYLNAEEVSDSKIKWQFINVVLPLLILIAFGVLFNYLRKRKYTL